MDVSSIVDDKTNQQEHSKCGNAKSTSVEESVVPADTNPNKVPVVSSNPKPTPVQDRLQKEIKFLNVEIVAVTERKESGLFNDDMRKKLCKKRELLTATKKKLRTTEREMKRKRTSRKEFKKKLK